MNFGMLKKRLIAQLFSTSLMHPDHSVHYFSPPSSAPAGAPLFVSVIARAATHLSF